MNYYLFINYYFEKKFNQICSLYNINILILESLLALVNRMIRLKISITKAKLERHRETTSSLFVNFSNTTITQL